MSAAELITWGATEDAQRKADLSTVPFSEANERATTRLENAGLTPHEAFEAVKQAQDAARQERLGQRLQAQMFGRK